MIKLFLEFLDLIPWVVYMRKRGIYVKIIAWKSSRLLKMGSNRKYLVTLV